jgi:diphthamide synthase subunit DPH2
MKRIKTIIVSLFNSVLQFFKKTELVGNLTNIEIEDLLSEKENPNIINLSNARIYTLDEKYKIMKLKDLQIFLKKDLTNLYPYQENYRDCEDFAIYVWNNIKKQYGNVAFGLGIGTSHSFNIYIDENKKVWAVEPQDDSIHDITGKYKPILIVI